MILVPHLKDSIFLSIKDVKSSCHILPTLYCTKFQEQFMAGHFSHCEKLEDIMKRRTLHDEENNEDYYYESMDGIHWYPVEPEEETEEEEE